MNKRYIKYRKEQIEGREIMVDASEQTNDISSISTGVGARKPGSPKGTTDKLKFENEQ